MEGVVAASSVWLLGILSVMIEEMATSRKRILALVTTVGISYAALAVVPAAYFLGISLPGVEAARFVGDHEAVRYLGVTNNPKSWPPLNSGIAMMLILLMRTRNIVSIADRRCPRVLRPAWSFVSRPRDRMVTLVAMLI
jgi:hypothetical protein